MCLGEVLAAASFEVPVAKWRMARCHRGVLAMITPRGIEVESAVYNVVEFSHAVLHRVVAAEWAATALASGRQNIRQTACGIDPAR